MASGEDDVTSQDNNKKKQFIRSNAVCGDDDTRLKPPSRFGSVKSRTSTTSSRDSNVEYTDSTGIDLYTFIVNTLHKNPKDREMLLHLESEMRKFVLDPSKQAFKFPKMSSYNRMLVHRVAAFFGLDHNVDQSGTLVVVTKTESTRVPDVEFERLIKSNAFTDRVLNRRDVHSFDESRLNACVLGYPPAFPFNGAPVPLGPAPVSQLDAMRRARSFEVGEWHNSMANATTPSSGGVASRQLSASSVHSVPLHSGPVPLASIAPFVAERSRHNSTTSPVVVEPIISPSRAVESPMTGYAPQAYYSPTALPPNPSVMDSVPQEEDEQSMYSNAASQQYFNPYQWTSADSYTSSTEFSPQPPAYVPFYQDGVQYMYPTGYAGAVPYYYSAGQAYGQMGQPSGTVYYAAGGSVYAPTAVFQSPSSGYSTDNGDVGLLEQQLGGMNLATSTGSPTANVDGTGEALSEHPGSTSTPLMTYSTPAFSYYTSTSCAYDQQLPPPDVTYAQSQQPYGTSGYPTTAYQSAQPLYATQYGAATTGYQAPYETAPYTGAGGYPYGTNAGTYNASNLDGRSSYDGQRGSSAQNKSARASTGKRSSATQPPKYAVPKPIDAKAGAGQ
ncbi:R3H domain containing protein [Aphelenchoides avenae]|nr:R3H domain containing protein [Aphelenchus avenae]